jgi:peptide/nickel transport system permease protein
MLDFGDTITTGLPIADLILSAFRSRSAIALATIVLTIAISIPLGTLAAFMAHKGHKGSTTSSPARRCWWT